MRMSLLLVAVVLVLRLRRLTKRLDPLFGLMMIDGDIRFCLDLVSYSSRSILKISGFYILVRACLVYQEPEDYFFGNRII